MSVRIELSPREQLRRARWQRRKRPDELARLRDREASLMTLCSEAPRQLALIQARIAEVTGHKP